MGGGGVRVTIHQINKFAILLLAGKGVNSEVHKCVFVAGKEVEEAGS